MTQAYIYAEELLNTINPDSVFVEIGSDFGVAYGPEGSDGSTLFLANLAEKFNTTLHTVDFKKVESKIIDKSNIVWHTEIGSQWAKNTYPAIGKKISLLYLDNHFFKGPAYELPIEEWIKQSVWTSDIYNNIKGADWPQMFVKFDELPQRCQDDVKVNFSLIYERMHYDSESEYINAGLSISNDDSQLEHFKQVYHLVPWLDDDCLIILDDSPRAGGVWYGKGGPCVSLLQTVGFKIKKVVSDGTGAVILQGKDKNGS